MSRGLLGGTFDPPHVGHLLAAREALERLGLRRVSFVPAAAPPHKQDRDITPARHRLAMLRAALAGEPGLDVDTVELEREGPSYTADTLRALRAARPAEPLVLLLGADQYAELDSWHDPDAVRALARLVVLAREGEGGDGGADTLALPRMDVSSTRVRERVAAGLPVRWLVPPAVETYIRDHGLYRTGPTAQG